MRFPSHLVANLHQTVIGTTFKFEVLTPQNPIIQFPVGDLLEFGLEVSPQCVLLEFHGKVGNFDLLSVGMVF